MYTPKILLLLTVAFLISGCANVYLKPEAAARIKNHRVIAIAPPIISFVPPNIPIPESHRMDAQLKMDLQKSWSVMFQKELYNRMMDRKKHHRMQVAVLPLDTTVLRLKKAGYFEHPDMSANQMCEILGVDGVITSNYKIEEPYSNAEAVLLELIPIIPTPRNAVSVMLEIYDRETRDPIWGFYRMKASTLGTSHAEIVYDLLNQASKKMPYRK